MTDPNPTAKPEPTGDDCRKCRYGQELTNAAVQAETERAANLCTTESMGKEIVCPEECAAAIRAKPAQR